MRFTVEGVDQITREQRRLDIIAADERAAGWAAIERGVEVISIVQAAHNESPPTIAPRRAISIIGFVDSDLDRAQYDALKRAARYLRMLAAAAYLFLILLSLIALHEASAETFWFILFFGGLIMFVPAACCLFLADGILRLTRSPVITAMTASAILMTVSALALFEGHSSPLALVCIPFLGLSIGIFWNCMKGVPLTQRISKKTPSHGSRGFEVQPIAPTTNHASKGGPTGPSCDIIPVAGVTGGREHDDAQS